MNTINQIVSKQIAIVDEINRLNQNWSRTNQQTQNDLFSELNTLAQQAYDQGFTLRGSILRFSVADSEAMYLVTKHNARWADVKHIEMGDAYRFLGVHDGKLDQVVASQVANRQRAWNEIFARKQ